MTRLSIWEKIAKTNGYVIEYRKHQYWDAIPHAVKYDENEKEIDCFPLAVIESENGTTSITTISTIVANESNYFDLQELADPHSYYFDPNNDFQFAPVWRNNSITKLVREVF